MAAPKNDNIREKILNTAYLMLQEKSFKEMSLSQIAKKTGISKGSIYYYYNSKDELLYDIADSYLNQLYGDLLTWVDNKEKDTSLPRVLYFCLKGGINEPEKSLRLHLVMDAMSGNSQLNSKLLNKYISFKNIFSEKIHERSTSINKEQADYYGWLLLTVIDGVIIQNLLGNPEISNEEFINRTVEIINRECN